MDIDDDLTRDVNALLREEPRLLAAAKLAGMVAAIYRPAKPERAPKAGAGPKRGRKSPPRSIDGSAPVGEFAGKAEDSGEVSAPPPGPPPCPSPWHGVAVPAKANGLAKFGDGKPILATLTIDGTLWEKLSEGDRRRALIIGLRGLRHKERKADGGDLATVERPPVRCWPDCADEARELMAALAPDGAPGAELLGAIAPGTTVERLEEALADIRRRVDAGQDLADDRRVLADAWTELGELVGLIGGGGEPDGGAA